MAQGTVSIVSPHKEDLAPIQSGGTPRTVPCVNTEGESALGKYLEDGHRKPFPSQTGQKVQNQPCYPKSSSVYILATLLEKR